MFLRTFLSLMLIFSFSATALAEAEMPKIANAGGQSLILNGTALRSKMGIKVYWAELYLPKTMSNGSEIISKDEARHLVMRFVRNVSGKKICGAWKEGLKANTPNASEELKGQFETLCQYTDGAKKGDAYTYTYVPGKGTTVSLNGAAKGTLAGKPFADALFKCWIGPQPGPGMGFKKDLLGGP